MRGNIVNWDLVGDPRDPQCRLQIRGALQHFMDSPNTPEVQAAMQHFSTTGDFPTASAAILKQYQLETPFDTGWEQVFDVVNFTNTKETSFEISEVEEGLAFEEVPVGHKARLYKMCGTRVLVPFQLYGGGLQWHRTLFDDGRYWKLEDNAKAFRNKHLSSKAQIHYNLIDALPAGQNVAWQAPVPAALANTDPNYAAIRDIETINYTCTQIITSLQGSGIEVNANSQFVLLAPLQLMGRITRALGLLNQSLAGSQRGVLFNVRPVWTTMMASTTSYYVVLPKEKMVSGNRMDMTVFTEFEPLSYSEYAVGWYRFAAVIGDVEQLRRCATA